MRSNFKLTRCESSRVHKLVEAGAFDLRTGQYQSVRLRDPSSAVFVVQHDWAAVLSDVVGEQAEFRLPYDYCVFEFRVLFSGGEFQYAGEVPHNVIVCASAVETKLAPDMLVFIQAGNGSWCTQADFEAARESAKQGHFDNWTWLNLFLFRQVCAICVALEAQVAEHVVVPAPAALNAKRARTGKPPLNDFHVVDLARRHRTGAEHAEHLAGGSGKVRLHLRRGHWRHYDETHKTWIEWTLVGNPDLGWVDKEYRI